MTIEKWLKSERFRHSILRQHLLTLPGLHGGMTSALIFDRHQAASPFYSLSTTAGDHMRVTRLDGASLDYWVAKSEGLKLLSNSPEEGAEHDHGSGFWHPSTYKPSSNWSQGGLIISNEWYDLENVLIEWFGPSWPFIKTISDEPLKWLMRAYVMTKFGEEVEEIVEITIYTPATIGKPEYQPMSSPRKWPSWFGRSQASKTSSNV